MFHSLRWRRRNEKPSGVAVLEVRGGIAEPPLWKGTPEKGGRVDDDDDEGGEWGKLSGEKMFMLLFCFCLAQDLGLFTSVSLALEGSGRTHKKQISESNNNTEILQKSLTETNLCLTSQFSGDNNKRITITSLSCLLALRPVTGSTFVGQ